MISSFLSNLRPAIKLIKVAPDFHKPRVIVRNCIQNLKLGACKYRKIE